MIKTINLDFTEMIIVYGLNTKEIFKWIRFQEQIKRAGSLLLKLKGHNDDIQ